MIPVEFMTESMEAALESITVNPRAQKYEFIGFNGVWVIPNLGSLLLFIALFPIRLLQLPLLSLFAKKYRQMKLRRQRLSYSLWNWPIVTTRESYIIIVMGSLLNISFVKWTSVSDEPVAIFNLTVAYILFAFTVVYPIIQACCLHRHRHKLKNKAFAEQFKSAYEGLKMTEGNYLVYNLFFFYRRLMIATCVIYFDSSVMTQFFTVTLTGLATVMLLALK